jgi:hypothetical protein
MVEEEGANSDICWQRVWLKLVLYANRITGQPKKVNQNGPVVRSVGEAVDPEDLVTQVLAKFLSKPTPDEPLTEEHLINRLKRSVSSAHIDLLRSVERRKTDYAEDLARPAEQGEGTRDFFDSYRAKKVRGFGRHEILSDPLPTPGEDDPLAIYREQLNELYERVKGDAKLEEMVRAVCEEDLEEPRDIAAYLKVPREDIYNRLKKLRRRYGDLLPPKLRQRKAI